MIRLKKRKPTAEADRCPDYDTKLEDAEKRASSLLLKAEWIHSVIAQRDRENHWQASVNQLFVGEQRL